MKTILFSIIFAVSTSVSAGNSDRPPVSSFPGGSTEYNPNGANGYEVWQDGQITETLEQDGAGGYERRRQGQTIETIRPQPGGVWKIERF
jgi:hypothetical protein